MLKNVNGSTFQNDADNEIFPITIDVGNLDNSGAINKRAVGQADKFFHCFSFRLITVGLKPCRNRSTG